MDSNDKDLVKDVLVYGGIGVGVFFLIKNISGGLFGSSAANVATVNNQAQTPPAQNFFSIQFQPFVTMFNANGSTNSDGSPMSMQQYFQALKSNSSSLSGGIAGLVAQTESIWSQVNPSIFNQLTTLATSTSNLIAQLTQGITGQTDVSVMAAYLYFNYNADLLNSLRGGLFKFGLSDDDVAQVINTISQLPQNGLSLPVLSQGGVQSAGSSNSGSGSSSSSGWVWYEPWTWTP